MLPSFSQCHIDDPELFWGCHSTPRHLRGYELEPVHGVPLTVTEMCDFLFCPRYAYLRHVLGFRPRVTPFGIRALFQHNIFVGLLAVEPEILADSNDRFEDFESVYLENGLAIARMEHHCLENAFTRVALERDREIALIESKIRQAALMCYRDSSRMKGLGSRLAEVSYAAPEIGIRGARIDIVEQDHPLDVKAGNAANLRASHILQLAWYVMVLEHSHWVDVDYGEVYFIRSLSREVVVIDNRVRAWAIAKRKAAAETLSCSSIPEGSGSCGTCLLREVCSQGTEQHPSSFSHIYVKNAHN